MPYKYICVTYTLPCLKKGEVGKQFVDVRALTSTHSKPLKHINYLSSTLKEKAIDYAIQWKKRKRIIKEDSEFTVLNTSMATYEEWMVWQNQSR